MTSTAMPRRGRAATAVAIGLVLCLLVVELGGTVYFWLQHRALVYLNEGIAGAVSTVTSAAGLNEGRQRLHPYFGFAFPYSETYETAAGTFYTNSLGFFQREKIALPVARGDRDFIVAVFGGSVAANLVLARRGGLQLGPALSKLPALAGRRAVVINMAQGSGKQPQQLLELAFLLALGQSLDFVVSVDGFNEFALGLETYLTGEHPSLPSHSITGALAREILPATAASVGYYEVAYEVSAARRDVERHDAAARAARYGTGFLVNRALLALDQITLKKYLERYAKAIDSGDDQAARRKMLGLDLRVDASHPDKVRDLYDLWMRSTDQMRLLAQANRIGFLHVVQPNQYFSKKTFTDRERQVALSLPPDHVYRTGLAAGYRMFEARAPGKTGTISAIALFDAVRDDVYFDNCCHFNALGETMLADFVAARVGESLAPSKLRD